MDASLTLRRVGIRRRSDDDVLAHAFDGDPVAFAEVYVSVPGSGVRRPGRLT